MFVTKRSDSIFSLFFPEFDLIQSCEMQIIQLLQSQFVSLFFFFFFG